MKDKKAIVIFSGGQDSTTCLYWAKQNFDYVETVFFNYGQKHRIEFESAKKICELSKTNIKVLNIPAFAEIGGSSLTDSSLQTPEGEAEGIPISFVPGRNLIFITLAAAYAYTKGITNLVTGVCETDFSNYPDCRKITMNSLEQTLYYGMETKFKILTPLMELTKAETVKLAEKVGALDALSYSHTCYNGKVPPCGKCASCLLRQKGFEEAGIEDPLITRTKN